MTTIRKSSLSDAERAKRIREAAREHETDNDPASFERAFDKVAKSKRDIANEGVSHQTEKR
jgi:hypothetical protein